MNMMRALIVGATGATGSDLLQQLLEDPVFSGIDIFVRRDPGIRHEKLRTHLIDFDRPEQWRHLLTGDVLFSCLGTTRKAAGSKKAQWEIDYEYQYQFAKAARENGVSHYVLVSSAGASPTSLLFYPKMKGQLEEAIKALGFPTLSILRPPILVRKQSDRSEEVAGVKVIRALNSLGLLRSQTPLPTHLLAKAMIQNAKTAARGFQIIAGQSIRTLSDV